MPRIPTYQRERTIPGKAGAVLASPEAAGRTGRALGQVAESLGGLADAIYKRNEAIKIEERNDSALRIANLVDNDALTFETQGKEKRGVDTYNSMDAVDAWEKASIEKYGNVQDDKLKTAVNGHVQAKALQLKRTLSGHESQQRDFVAADTRKAVLDGGINAAFAGSGTLEDNLALFNKAISSDTRLRDTEQESMILAGQSDIAEARLKGIITRDPAAGVAAIKAGTFNQYLDAKKQAVYAAQAQPVIDAQDAKSEASGIWDELKPKTVNDKVELATMRERIRTGKSSEKVKALAEKEVESLAAEWAQQKRLDKEGVSNEIVGLAINKKQGYSAVVRAIYSKTEIDEEARSGLLDWADRHFRISEGRAEAKSEAKRQRELKQQVALYDFMRQYNDGLYGKLTTQQVSKETATLGAFTDDAMRFVSNVNMDLGKAKVTEDEFNATVRILRQNESYKSLLPDIDKQTPADKANLALLQNHVQELVSSTSAVAPGKGMSVKEAILKAIPKVRTDLGSTFAGFYDFGEVDQPIYIAAQSEDASRWSRAAQDAVIDDLVLRKTGKPATPSQRDALRKQLMKKKGQ